MTNDQARMTKEIRILIIASIPLFLILQACRTPYRVPDWPEVPQPVKSTVQAMANQHQWTLRRVEVWEPHFVGGNWRVKVVALPATPGRFTDYDISPTGGVVRAYGG